MRLARTVDRQPLTSTTENSNPPPRTHLSKLTRNLLQFYCHFSFFLAILGQDIFNVEETYRFVDPSHAREDAGTTSPVLNPLFGTALAMGITAAFQLARRFRTSNQERRSCLHPLTEAQESLYVTEDSPTDVHSCQATGKQWVTNLVMAAPFYGIGHAAGGALAGRFMPRAPIGWHYLAKAFIGFHVAQGSVTIYGLEARRHGNLLKGLYQTFIVTPFQNKTTRQAIKNILQKLLAILGNFFEAKYGSDALVEAEADFFGSAGIVYSWISAALVTMLVGLTETTALDELETPAIRRENLTRQERGYLLLNRLAELFSGGVHAIPPTVGFARLLANATHLNEADLWERMLVLSASSLTIGITATAAFAAMLRRTSENQVYIERAENFMPSQKYGAFFGKQNHSPQDESIQLQITESPASDLNIGVSP